MNKMAYPAIRVWRMGTRAGVAFEGSARIGADLPSNPLFLDQMFVHGKLRQIERLSAQGIEFSEVLRTAGISRETYRRWQQTFVF
jgi:hypothetical protein